MNTISLSFCYSQASVIVLMNIGSIFRELDSSREQIRYSKIKNKLHKAGYVPLMKQDILLGMRGLLDKKEHLSMFTLKEMRL